MKQEGNTGKIGTVDEVNRCGSGAREHTNLISTVVLTPSRALLPSEVVTI